MENILTHGTAGFRAFATLYAALPEEKELLDQLQIKFAETERRSDPLTAYSKALTTNPNLVKDGIADTIRNQNFVKYFTQMTDENFTDSIMASYNLLSEYYTPKKTSFLDKIKNLFKGKY